MKQILSVTAVVAATTILAAVSPIDEESILARGDANNNGVVDMADATYISNWLYQGGPEPPCMNQADANDDGTVDVSDPVYLLNWLYQGGSAPPSPGPFNTHCTTDEEPRPGCEQGCS